MTNRLPCPTAPGPLEEYVGHFDDRLGTLAQRRGFREYLQGLLLPRDRHKTLTGLVGTEPIVGAQAPSVQRLQFFLAESPWDAEAVNRRRLELLGTDPATMPHEAGVLVIDDSGDRNAGTKTAHVARQYLGSIGELDDGIVAVTSLWADERGYYPLYVTPYTPAARLPKGKADPDFRTSPQLAVGLVDAALEAGFSFRAVVAAAEPAQEISAWKRTRVPDAAMAENGPTRVRFQGMETIRQPEGDPVSQEMRSASAPRSGLDSEKKGP